MRHMLSVTLLILATAGTVSAEVTDIDNATLHRLLGEGATIVDIRTPYEWKKTGVVEGSHLLMFFDSRGRHDLQGWVAKLGRIAEPKEPLILICRTGNRTPGVAEYLDKKAGYKEVYNVRDGIMHWISEDHPTVKPTMSEPTKAGIQ